MLYGIILVLCQGAIFHISDKITLFAMKNHIPMNWNKSIFLLFVGLISTINISAQDTDFLMDERDGNIYLVAKFTNQWWFCQNLKYDIGEGSSCYDDDDNNCMLKGRWYTFDAAKKACPSGYRLPSDDDWKALEASLGMEPQDMDLRYNRNSGDVGKKLKFDGESGFHAEVAGIRHPRADDSYIDSHAYFWTSTEINETTAWSRVLNVEKDGIDRQIINNDFSLSVRCVKDAEQEKE